MPLPSYEESIEILKQRKIIGADESPPQPSKMPEPDDDRPLGLSFYRMGFAEGADLGGLSIARTFFGRSEIANVSFRGTDLTESNLRWNDFVDVDFSDALLLRADLRASEYLRVNFTNANLSGADLRYANFDDCTFAGTILEGALLARGQEKELGLDDAQIAQVSWQTGHGPEPSGG